MSRAAHHTLVRTTGDCLVERRVCPYFDVLITLNEGVRRFHFDGLERCLSFLELVVLNERIILGDCDIFDIPNRKTRASAKALFEEFLWVPNNEFPGFSDRVMQELLAAGVVYPSVIANTEDSSPRMHVQRLIANNEQLKSRWDAVVLKFERLGYSNSVASDLATTSMAKDVGGALHIAHMSATAAVPHILSSETVHAVRDVTSFEIATQRGVIEYLRTALNAAAQKDLAGLEKLGGRVVFPRTPISAQLLADASTPYDLVRVALQLRDECRSFRRVMCELERDLLDDNTTLGRRLKLQREVEALAEELTAGMGGEFRKDAMAGFDLAAAMQAIPAVVVGQGVTGFLRSLCSQPIDRLLRLLRRRKVRVMLKSRKRWLAASGFCDRVGTIFRLNPSEIADALERYEDRQRSR